MTDLTGKTVAMLATDGFEQSELTEPKHRLEALGAKVDVVALDGQDSIRGWDKKDWGESVKVDRQLGKANAGDYDALVLPGGVINPDHLRREAAAVAFVKAFAADDKPVAAICHGPWMLAETGLAKGRRLTSWSSLKTDLTNAGGRWEDSEVVVDGKLITSRNPDDIPAFSKAIADALAS
ncbi:type 1 glutamine amidotransferase domain-containing protein [Pseudoxanthomonas sp. JBR18]|uniref:type 1 glutamine amidotransferase domain-containing protein n=1 Tax=Pseudoxanthomonas sp. JBR18 TaxID=2969308 RepID=UPI0023068077|nr:type 1 glutamine amidotransferase domain-containing protein [Pseudoxanthomonas sp. JBR18]WCE04337.1 type 1 glutamine amidotransferase [Pseudoxanthomonas sp. JBR18]